MLRKVKQAFKKIVQLTPSRKVKEEPIVEDEQIVENSFDNESSYADYSSSTSESIDSDDDINPDGLRAARSHDDDSNSDGLRAARYADPFPPTLHSIGIKIYKDDNRIQVRCDVIYHLNDCPLSSWDFIFYDIRSSIRSNFPCTNSDVLNKNFNYQMLDPLSFTSSDQGRFARHGVIFELPTIPHLAINFISTLLNIIESKASFYRTHVNFVCEFVEGYLKKHEMQMKMSDYIKALRSDEESLFDDKKFVARILKFTQISADYAAVNKAITVIQQHANTTHYTFNHSIYHYDRHKKSYLIMLGKTGDDLIDPSVPAERKISLLVDLASSLLKSNQSHELNYMIDILRFNILNNFYMPCVGKVSCNGEDYSWLSPIKMLLDSFQFTIRPDQRMSITNLKNNRLCREYYSNRLFLSLQQEISHLAGILGLDISPDSDFDNEIIFTPACTEKLKAQGLHFDQAYIKSLLKKMNQWSLFKQAHRYEYDADDHQSYFCALPIEMTSMISDELNPNIARDEAEIIKAYSRPRLG